jgi:hypothetical protein
MGGSPHFLINCLKKSAAAGLPAPWRCVCNQRHVSRAGQRGAKQSVSVQRPPSSVGTFGLGENKLVFGRNISYHAVSIGLQSLPPPWILTGGSGVRDTMDLIWMRKVLNCFRSL